MSVNCRYIVTHQIKVRITIQGDFIKIRVDMEQCTMPPPQYFPKDSKTRSFNCNSWLPIWIQRYFFKHEITMLPVNFTSFITVLNTHHDVMKHSLKSRKSRNQNCKMDIPCALHFWDPRALLTFTFLHIVYEKLTLI
jgi:hypothetical protein